jgi:hypothetical protein
MTGPAGDHGISQRGSAGLNDRWPSDVAPLTVLPVHGPTPPTEGQELFAREGMAIKAVALDAMGVLYPVGDDLRGLLIPSKVFAAEVTNPLGIPVKNVEVLFVLDGEGSLAADTPVSSAGGRTDGLGCASISYNRPSGVDGRIGASLKALCATDVGQIRLRFLAMTAEHSGRDRA